MLKFILCDDDIRHNAYMKKRIERILSDNKIEGVVSIIASVPEEVMDYCNSHKSEDSVYILDIDLQNKINGVDLAKYIRKADARAYIVYVSAHQEYSMLCYKTKTFDFLLKPVQKKILEDCILNLNNDYTTLLSNSNPSMSIKSGSKVHMITISDIVYCEKFGNIAVFHTKNGAIRSYDSLESMQGKLQKHDFFRCHKSFLINMNCVEYIAVDENTVYFKNGEKCGISRNYKKGLLEYGKNNL